MLRRAALVAAALAPAFPSAGLAQITPDKAAQLQRQIQDWLQATLGTASTPTRDAVHVSAAGDHYDLSVPIGPAPDAPALTGKMTSAGDGRWLIDDVKAPSPNVFHYKLPPSQRPGGLTGDITTTLTLGDQQQRILFDPTLATPSTWTSSTKDVRVDTVGAGVVQLSHIDSVTGTSSMTPAPDGRVDIAVNSTLDGYTMKMSGEPPKPPFTIGMGHATLAANLLGLSRTGGLEVIGAIAKANAGLTGSPSVPLDPKAGVALLGTLDGLASSVSLDEKIGDITFSSGNDAGSVKSLSLGFDSKAADGKVQARLALALDGIVPPELGLGQTARLIPTKIALTPTVADVPVQALTRLLRELAGKQHPSNADIAALFSQGPITLGLDDVALDAAGTSFRGHVTILAASPASFSGTGQITADDIDKLQRAMAADPQTASMTPFLIFLKGIGRSEQGRLVWDLAYRDGHLVVNGQDMAALLGPPAQPQPAPGRRPSP